MLFPVKNKANNFAEFFIIIQQYFWKFIYTYTYTYIFANTIYEDMCKDTWHI